MPADPTRGAQGNPDWLSPTRGEMRVTKNSEVSGSLWLLRTLIEFEWKANVCSSFPGLVSVIMALG